MGRNVASLSRHIGLMMNTEKEVERLRSAIRKHMNMRGDDRCYQDDHELYLVLPEGDTRPTSETLVTIENCERYIKCRQEGRECDWVSPQRRIEELEKEIDSLQAYVKRLEVYFLLYEKGVSHEEV